jgi:NAD(P)-dependent dehydrogenase (short-subunit alcohol dehydrogenase family)
MSVGWVPRTMHQIDDKLVTIVRPSRLLDQRERREKMDLKLKGKVAIITGGSDGIGKAAALSLSREGARVAIAARTEATLANAVKEIIDETGNEVIGIPTDVTDEAQVEALINEVVSKWGGIDILVNNAGTSSVARLQDLSNEQMMGDIQLKVYGAI